MKKKVLLQVMGAVLVAGLMAVCGGTNDTKTEENTKTEAAADNADVPSATSRHHALQRERLRRHVRNLSGLLSEQTKVDAAVGAVFKKVGTVGKIVGLAMFQHKKGAFLYQS